MNKHLDFDELLEYLEDEVVQIEYMRKNRNKVESVESEYAYMHAVYASYPFVKLLKICSTTQA